MKQISKSPFNIATNQSGFVPIVLALISAMGIGMIVSKQSSTVKSMNKQANDRIKKDATYKANINALTLAQSLLTEKEKYNSPAPGQKTYDYNKNINKLPQFYPDPYLQNSPDGETKLRSKDDLENGGDESLWTFDEGKLKIRPDQSAININNKSIFNSEINIINRVADSNHPYLIKKLEVTSTTNNITQNALLKIPPPPSPTCTLEITDSTAECSRTTSSAQCSIAPNGNAEIKIQMKAKGVVAAAKFNGSSLASNDTDLPFPNHASILSDGIIMPEKKFLLNSAGSKTYTGVVTGVDGKSTSCTASSNMKIIKPKPANPFCSVTFVAQGSDSNSSGCVHPRAIRCYNISESKTYKIRVQFYDPNVSSIDFMRGANATHRETLETFDTSGGKVIDKTLTLTNDNMGPRFHHVISIDGNWPGTNNTCGQVKIANE